MTEENYIDPEIQPYKKGNDGRILTHLWDWIDLLPMFFITFVLFVVLSVAAVFLAGGGVDANTGAPIEGDSFLLLVFSLFSTMLAMLIPYFGINVLRHRHSLAKLGFGKVDRKWIWWAIGLGIAGTVVRIGIGSGLLKLFPFLEAGAEELSAMFTFDAGWQMVAIGLMASLIVPIYEEIFFRGVVHNSLRRRVGMWIVTILCGAIFGMILARSSSAVTLDMSGTLSPDDLAAVMGEIGIGFVAGGAGAALVCGLIQFFLKDRAAFWLSIIASSAVFGLFHGFPIQVITAFLFGLIVGWLYERSDSLWPGIVCHVTNNGVVMLVSLISFFMGVE